VIGGSAVGIGYAVALSTRNNTHIVAIPGAAAQRKNRQCERQLLGESRTERALRNPVDDDQPAPQCGPSAAPDNRGR
jgi:hypothetical protein